ncbi:MAG: HemK2/MTQ2 family protein methyltransferase [Candidatus Nanohaloarchaea archaeon]
MTVYQPAEDTYFLLDYLEDQELEGKKVLEVGSGSGKIAVELAGKGAEVTAVDINPEAVRATEQLAEQENVDLEVRRSDMFDEVRERFDLVVFNPPYLPGEEDIGDEEIWRGGEEGIEVTREFLREVDGYLREDGGFILVASSLADLEELDETLERERSRELWFETLYILRGR